MCRCFEFADLSRPQKAPPTQLKNVLSSLKSISVRSVCLANFTLCTDALQFQQRKRLVEKKTQKYNFIISQKDNKHAFEQQINSKKKLNTVPEKVS